MTETRYWFDTFSKGFYIESVRVNNKVQLIDEVLEIDFFVPLSDFNTFNEVTYDTYRKGVDILKRGMTELTPAENERLTAEYYDLLHTV